MKKGEQERKTGGRGRGKDEREGGEAEGKGRREKEGKKRCGDVRMEKKEKREEERPRKGKRGEKQRSWRRLSDLRLPYVLFAT